MLQVVPINSEEETTNKIVLSLNNFKDNVKIKENLLDELGSVKKESCPSKPEESFACKLEKAFFPSDDTLSKFAKAVYNDVPGNVVDGWTLLTTAFNKSDEYFGAAFCNEKDLQVVIAHRGTNLSKLKVLNADIDGIIRNQFTPQISSASSFVDHVLQQLPAEKVSVSFTGHSLGAWLAQLTAFTLKYLTIRNKKFCLKPEGDFTHHPHTVGFESPGARTMLKKLAELYHFRYETRAETLIEKLDVTNYLTLPNQINCCNEHVGDLKMIVIDRLEKERLNFLEYALHYHSMDNIASAMNPQTEVDGEGEERRGGRLRILEWPIAFLSRVVQSGFRSIFNWSSSRDNCLEMEYGEDKVRRGCRMRILEWPCSYWPDRAITHSKVPFAFLNDLSRVMNSGFRLIWDWSLSSANCSEMEYYKKKMKNKLDPFEESEKDVTYGIVLRLKVVKINERICRTNVFTETEMTFLASWLVLKKQSIQFTFDYRVESYDLNGLMESLPDFCLVENNLKIECDNKIDLEKVVNVLKQLFRRLSHSGVLKMNAKMAEISKCSFQICKLESKNFIRENCENEFNFKDTIKLQMFIESKDLLFVLKSAEPSNLETTRIYSILKRLKRKNHIFLDWERIVRLNELIFWEKTFASENGHSIIILDCQKCSNDGSEYEQKILEKILNNLTNKFILITNSKSNITYFASTNQTVTSTFEFSDFLDDSREILSQKTVILNNVPYGLSELIDREGMEKLSFKAFAMLNKGDLKIETVNLKLANPNNFYIQSNEEVNIDNFIDDFSEQTDSFVIISNGNEFLDANDELDSVYCAEKMKKIRKFENDDKLTICSKIDENQASEIFKDLCKSAKHSKIIWLKLVSSCLYLKQIYDKKLYIQTKLNKSTKLNNKEVFNFMANESSKNSFILSYSGSINGGKKLNKQIFFKFFNVESVLSHPKDQFYKKLEKSIFCCEESEAQSKFDNIVSLHRNKSVHWLNLVGNLEVHWHKSHGQVDRLTNFLDKDEVNPHDNNSLLNERFVVICDEPGMGKSTYLMDLAENLGKAKWVIIHVDLATHQQQLLTFPINDFNDIVSLMVQAINSEPKDLHKEILLRFQQIIFLFDGFAELNEQGRKRFLHVLKILRDETEAKVWITTSVDHKSHLENHLSIFSTKFIRFNKQEQIDFLVKYWKCCLHFQRFDENLLEGYAREMLDEAGKMVWEEIHEFLGNPRNLRIVAEVAWPLVKQHITCNYEALALNNHYEFMNFFREYTKIKYDNYINRQKVQQCDYLVNYAVNSTLEKQFRELAFQILFCHQYDHVFGFQVAREEQLMSDLLRVGLIQLIDQQPRFIYHVLTQYFVMDFLLHWLKTFPNQQQAVINLLLGKSLIEEEYAIFTMLLNSMLERDF